MTHIQRPPANPARFNAPPREVALIDKELATKELEIADLLRALAE